MKWESIVLILCFPVLPLWAGIATEDQAREIVYNELLNPNEFWSAYPIPALDIAGDREYYTSESGSGVGLDPFLGWSLLGHFFMFEEGFDLDISWPSK